MRVSWWPWERLVRNYVLVEPLICSFAIPVSAARTYKGERSSPSVRLWCKPDVRHHTRIRTASLIGRHKPVQRYIGSVHHVEHIVQPSSPYLIPSLRPNIVVRFIRSRALGEAATGSNKLFYAPFENNSVTNLHFLFLYETYFWLPTTFDRFL